MGFGPWPRRMSANGTAAGFLQAPSGLPRGSSTPESRKGSDFRGEPEGLRCSGSRFGVGQLQATREAGRLCRGFGAIFPPFPLAPASFGASFKQVQGLPQFSLKHLGNKSTGSPNLVKEIQGLPQFLGTPPPPPQLLLRFGFQAAPGVPPPPAGSSCPAQLKSFRVAEPRIRFRRTFLDVFS